MNDGALDVIEAAVTQAMGVRLSPFVGPLGRTLHDARILEAAGSPAAAGELLAGGAIAALAVGSGSPAGTIAQITRLAARATGADEVRIGLMALAEPTALSAPLDLALQAHATILAGVTGARSVAVWRIGAEAAPRLTASAGPSDPEGTRATVAQRLCGDRSAGSTALVFAFGEPCAVIAWMSDGDDRLLTCLAERSAGMLTLTFERAAADGEDRHAALARAAERRLSRVAFDLHDGPLQDVALLRGELARLRGMLRLPRAAQELADPAAQVEDLLAIAEATEADLRDLAITMESSNLGQRDFEESLRGTIRAFTLRSGLEVEVALLGDASELTSMERMALLRLIGEALANAREHAEPERVTVTVHAGPRTVDARITDDGNGFDVDATLPQAARRGSMGLIGMLERVRLLGGTCEISSVPGRGTTVHASFERFFSSAAGGAEQERGAA